MITDEERIERVQSDLRVAERVNLELKELEPMVDRINRMDKSSLSCAYVADLFIKYLSVLRGGERSEMKSTVGRKFRDNWARERARSLEAMKCLFTEQDLEFARLLPGLHDDPERAIRSADGEWLYAGHVADQLEAAMKAEAAARTRLN